MEKREQVTVTLDAEELRRVRARAEALGVSVSDVLTAVVRDARRAEARAQLVRALGGPLSARELQSTLAEWQPKEPRP
jgi:hypothetical protein